MPTPTGHPTDYLPTPTGMATSLAPSMLAPNQAQYLRGFLPARKGKLKLAPFLKTPATQPNVGDIHGCAIWKTPGTSGFDTYDYLVIAHNNKLYAAIIQSVFTLDQRADGPHSYLKLGAFANITLPLAANSANVYNFVQFKGELVVSAGGMLHRFYVDNSQNLKAYALGLPPPAAPALAKSFVTATDLTGTGCNGATPQVSSATYTFVASDVGKTINVTSGVNWTVGAYVIASVSGGKANLSTACASVAAPTGGAYYISGDLSYASSYDYLSTWVDEFQRESSPSPISTIVTGTNSGAGANDRVTLTRPTTNSVVTNGGAAFWNIYRRNPGSTTFNLVAQVAYATTTYLDTNSDALVQAVTQISPTAGENDPPQNVSGAASGPGTAYAMTVWNNCLVLDYYQSSQFQISNIGSPTQFSSLPIPSQVTGGVQFTLQDPTGGWVSGFADLGDRLVVFTTSSYWVLYGTNAANYDLRRVGTSGCINAKSIQKTPVGVLFMSFDGVHVLDMGLSVDGGSGVAISSPVSNLMNGWIPIADPEEPTSTGLVQPAQTQNSIWGAVNSWFLHNRYFLSFGNITLVFDTEANGWSDAGYGFVKTVCTYASGMAGFGFQTPEAVFLATGDQNSWGSVLQYWTVVDTPGDIDSPTDGTATYITRPLGKGEDRLTITKRPDTISQFASTAATGLKPIGKVKWFVDGIEISKEGGQDVVMIATKRRGSLFEVSPPSCKGSLLWAEFTFTPHDIELYDAVWEFEVVA